MNFPKLVLKSVCKTPIKVTIDTGELGEDGEPIPVETISTTCNYQNGTKTILDNDKQVIEVFGTAIFRENIFPDKNDISGGQVEVFGETRNIVKCIKARNPDGTVNYVQLELI